MRRDVLLRMFDGCRLPFPTVPQPENIGLLVWILKSSAMRDFALTHRLCSLPRIRVVVLGGILWQAYGSHVQAEGDGPHLPEGHVVVGTGPAQDGQSFFKV